MKASMHWQAMHRQTPVKPRQLHFSRKHGMKYCNVQQSIACMGYTHLKRTQEILIYASVPHKRTLFLKAHASQRPGNKLTASAYQASQPDQSKALGIVLTGATKGLGYGSLPPGYVQVLHGQGY